MLRDSFYVVHHRLAIIDTTAGANQPSIDSDTGTTLAFNGEIYNFRELAHLHGYPGEAHSDTLVLHWLLKSKGIDALGSLNGMFALCLHDPKTNSVLLARDRLGIKPLYMLDTPTVIAFASEAKVLYCLLDTLQVNPRALAEYLEFGSGMSREAFVRNVYKVEPGTAVHVDLATHDICESTFWYPEMLLERPDTQEATRMSTITDATDRLRETLRSAVHRQCVSDVGVGVYLSGGLDSAALVAYASERLGGSLNTFTARFEGQDTSESEHVIARRIAEHFGTVHHEIVISPANLVDDLTRLIFQYDDPFADPAILPLHQLGAAAAANGTRVVLQGDGGDEILAGYGRHLLISRLQRTRLKALLLSYLHPNSHARSAYRGLLGRLRQPELGAVYANLVRKEGPDWTPMLHVNLEDERPERTIMDAIWATRSMDQDTLKRALVSDLSTQLRHTFLDKVDRASMLHSVEARVPFLDNDMLQFLMSVNSTHLTAGGKSKNLLRRALAGTVPESILLRKKHYFGTPMPKWLSGILGNWVDDVVASGDGHGGAIVNCANVATELSRFRMHHQQTPSWAWRIAVLLVWLNQYSGRVRV